MGYEMGLRPWEFDRLSPAQLTKMAEAHKKRQQDQWYKLAWLACYIIAPHSKHKMTPEKLLGLPPKKADKVKLVVGRPEVS